MRGDASNRVTSAVRRAGGGPQDPGPRGRRRASGAGARDPVRRVATHLDLDLPAMSGPRVSPSAASRAAADRARAAISAVHTRIGRRRLRLLDVALRGGFVVALVLFAIYRPVVAADAHAYWAVNLADPYSRPIATTDAFTYPPPAAQVAWVLGHLPWPVFQAAWTILIGLALLWMAGPWSLFI